MLLLTNKTIEKLQHDLVRDGLIDIDGLVFAQDCCKKNNSNLAEELVNEKLISEDTLLNFIENKLHVPYVNLSDYTPDTDCLKYVSAEDAKKYNIFPLFKIEDVLTIAMSDPLDLFTINTLFEFKNISIEPVVCSENSIKDAINNYYFEHNDKENITWQDKIVTDNITDELIKETISDIFNDAISVNCRNVFMEWSQNGLNVYFERELMGFIPNLIVPRFIYELKVMSSLDIEIENLPQNSRFILNDRRILSAYFPTKYGARFAFNINKNLLNIDNNIQRNKIDNLLNKPALIAINSDDNDVTSDFVYNIAAYLSENHSVLMVEAKSKCELNNVVQIEYGNNVGIYFDDIIKQIEFQKFDIIFWEKVYSEEQCEKLKLLSSEKTVVTVPYVENMNMFDKVISISDFQ